MQVTKMVILYLTSMVKSRQWRDYEDFLKAARLDKKVIS